MKKYLSVILICIFTVLTFSNIYAANGKIIDGKTYVPVRGVFEELGFKVEYDNNIATAIILNDNFTIKIPKDKTYFIVNDKTIEPESPQKIIDGSMYLPLRAIADSVGATTNWDNNTKTATVQFDGKESFVLTDISNTEKPANIIEYERAGEDGTEYYKIRQDLEQPLIDYVEQNIKNGNGGKSIIGEVLKYPHSAEFSDSKINYVIKRKESKYNCEYSAHISGYVTAQLPTGIKKETRYYADVYFNASDKEFVDMTLDYVMIIN